jgi:hypothetical protein
VQGAAAHQPLHYHLRRGQVLRNGRAAQRQDQRGGSKDVREVHEPQRQ